MIDLNDYDLTQLRAIIVVDSCAIQNLAAPIPEQKIVEKRRSSDPMRFYDGLECLAEARSHLVIIPSMVAFETSQRVTKQHGLRWLFDHAGAEETRCRRLENMCMRFFTQSTNSKNIIIALPSDNDQTKPANFIRKLWRILSDTMTVKGTKRSGVIEFNKQNPVAEKYDYGEQAAFEIIKSLKTDLPIYFLSNDKQALRKAKALGAHMLTAEDFVSAMCKKHIYSKLAVAITASEAIAEIRAFSRSNKTGFGEVCEKRKEFINRDNRTGFGLTLEHVLKPKFVKRDTALDKFSKRYGGLFPQS